MRINFATIKLITLLPLVSLMSCSHEATLPKAASIDLLMYKATSVSYSPGKRPINFAFTTPDSVSFMNSTLYRGTISQATYEYDDQKRIVKSQVTDLERPNDTYLSGNEVRTYKYDAQTVTPHSTRYPVTPSMLNPEGYIAEGYTYDQNGHRIKGEFAQGGKLENIILNGNIIQQNSSNLGSGQTALTIYEYDLTKPNLPDPFKNLNGKPSYNLPVKETAQVTYTGGGYKSVTTYTYKYDQRGLPKRCIASTEEGYLTMGNPKSTSERVVITDFEFAQ